jgi:FAD/FMN-containing dehydrogenase
MSTPWITAGDATWDVARTPWNVAADQRPAGAVIAETADDVADAVRLARKNGLRVKVQNTGHAASPRHALDDVLLVRTPALTDVSVDPVARTVRVGGGTQWQAVAEAAAPHGLAGLSGSSGGVGVVGYALGGGTGWLGRAHGFASSSIVSADVVLADGTQLRVDDENESDLMWALRGGGGSFAAVTSLELELVSTEQLYGGTLFFPVERAAEVLTAWRTWIDSVPEAVTSTGRVVNVPPVEEAPEFLRGKSFALVQAVMQMPESDAVALLEPLRALGAEIDTFAPVTPPELGMIHMDPPGPVPADIEGWLLDRLGDEEIAAVVASSGTGSPLVAVQVRHMGGALGRPGARSAALSSLDEPFLAYGVGVTPDPEVAAAVRSVLDGLRSSLGLAVSGRGQMNFAEAVDPSVLFPDDVWQRLQRVRSAYDPDRVFVATHDVG